MVLNYYNFKSFFILCLFFIFYIFQVSITYSFEKDEVVENLLNNLQVAENKVSADEIRRKIWYKWIYSINEKLLQKLQFALDEFYSGRLQSAEKAFTLLIEEDPSYIEGWNKRATIRYMLDDLEGSLRDIDKVLKLQPRHFGAISGLGLIYFKKKQYSKSLKSYQVLGKLDPMNDESKKFIKLLKNLIIENSA